MIHLQQKFWMFSSLNAFVADRLGLDPAATNCRAILEEGDVGISICIYRQPVDLMAE